MNNNSHSFFSNNPPNFGDSFLSDRSRPSLFGAETHAMTYSLGVDLTLPTVDFSTGPQLSIRPEVAVPPLDTCFAYNSLKVGLTSVPPVFASAELIYDTAVEGEKLAKNISLAQKAGHSTTEAIVCQSAASLTDLGLKTLGTAALFNGIPAYAAASVANPALLAVAPGIAMAMPDAYRGVDIAGQLAGNFVEHECHNAFAIARKISKGK